MGRWSRGVKRVVVVGGEGVNGWLVWRRVAAGLGWMGLGVKAGLGWGVLKRLCFAALRCKAGLVGGWNFAAKCWASCTSRVI